MLLSGMGVLSENDKAMVYLASVLHIESGEAMVEARVDVAVASVGVVGEDDKAVGDGVEVTMGNTLEDAYKKSGQSKVLLADIEMHGLQQDFQLTKMQFRLRGTEPVNLLKVYLYDGEKLLGEALSHEGVFEFENLEQLYAVGEVKSYQLKADLSEGLKSGERFRLDMEVPSRTRGPYTTIVGGAE